VEVARAAGVHVPAAALLGSDDARAIAAVGEYVIKPRLSCAGRGVGLFPRGAPLPEPDPAAPAIVQARVRGEECSTFAVAHQGRVIGNVSYRGVLRSGTVAVCFEQVRDLPAVDEWVGRFVAARNWSGFIAFDFIVDAAGLPWGIECNPRANSGIHFVEEDSLAQAILQPASTDRLRFRPPGWRQPHRGAVADVAARLRSVLPGAARGQGCDLGSARPATLLADDLHRCEPALGLGAHGQADRRDRHR
jgi:hypothetical protein